MTRFRACAKHTEATPTSSLWNTCSTPQKRDTLHPLSISRARRLSSFRMQPSKRLRKRLIDNVPVNRYHLHFKGDVHSATGCKSVRNFSGSAGHFHRSFILPQLHVTTLGCFGSFVAGLTQMALFYKLALQSICAKKYGYHKASSVRVSSLQQQRHPGSLPKTAIHTHEELGVLS